MNRRLTPTASEERAVLRSITYAAIFEYPLTLEQLHESLMEIPASGPEIIGDWYAASPALQDAIDYRDGYFFPRGRRDLLDRRHRREVISRSMLQQLRWPLQLVLRMPFVRMVAISGSLAHLNADGEADLDLFVITAPGRVWSVTTTLLAAARLFGWRRRLCLNYVVSERHLAVEPEDLFSANQIIHLRPLAGADVYRRFLDANRFVHDYYPNFSPRTVPPSGNGRARALLEGMLHRSIAPAYERLCRVAYSWHLKRRAATWASRDQVRLEPECLKLHTSSHRRAVMDAFTRAMEDLERVTPAEALPVPAAR